MLGANGKAALIAVAISLSAYLVRLVLVARFLRNMHTTVVGNLYPYRMYLNNQENKKLPVQETGYIKHQIARINK